MPALVACPKCKTRLKLNSLPAESKKIQCPKCQTYFMVSAPKPTDVTAKPPVKAPPGKTSPAVRPAAPGSGKGKWIGIAAAVLLAVGGGSAAYIFTRSEPNSNRTAPTPNEAQVAANKDKDNVKEEPAKKEDAHEKPRVRDKRHHEFTRHMVKAGQDSQARRYEPAIGHYDDALRIFGDDKDALQGKQDAQDALAAQNLAAKSDDKNKTDLTKIIKQGNDALGKRQYATALEYFKIAVQKSPDDPDAKGGLTTASEAMARSADEQKKQADQVALEQKKLDDYDAYLKGAQDMLAAKNYADAYQKAVLAQAIFPTNEDAVAKATDLRKLAEQGLAGLQNQDDRKKQFSQLMAQGGAALQNNRADEAQQVYKQALALYPDDPTAAKGVADAQSLGMRLQAQLKAQFQIAMNQGSQAFANNQFDVAVTAFLQATSIFPDDKMAQAALSNAQQAFNYSQAMNRAMVAMMVPNYPAAISAYGDALAVVPGDPPALQGLQNAQKGLAAYLIARQQFDTNVAQAIPLLLQQQNAAAFALLDFACKLLPTHPNIVYTQQLTNYAGGMTQGPVATTAKKYPDAVIAYTNAVNAVTPLAALPINDPLAQQLLPFATNALATAQQTQLKAYSDAMNQGQLAMTGKNYANAVAAFQNALAAVPNDMPAAQALSNAQALLLGTNQAQQLYAARVQAANALLAQQKYIEALQVWNEAIKLAPDSATAATAQKQATYAQAMSNGKTAVAANSYANAIAAFQSALAAVPNDAVAQQELKNAQQLQQGAGLTRKDFDSKVQQANALIKQQKYAEASQMFANAITVLPKDPQVAGLQTQILYANSMAKGQTALTAKSYNDAIAAFTDALGNMPKDAAAHKGIADAQQALQAVALANLSKDFASKVQQGTTLLTQLKYAEAAALLNSAIKEMPKNPQVAAVQLQANYAGAMARAGSAMTAKNYSTAVAAYNDALKVTPGDTNATLGLQNAQQALNSAGQATAFNAKMQLANALLFQKKYADAAKAFNDAAKLMPGNQQVATQATYADAMSRGQIAASAKNYTTAVAAYGDALTAKPGDINAQQALTDVQNASQAAAGAAKDYDNKVQQAKAFLKQQKFTEASQAFSDAAKLMPNSPPNAKVASEGRYADAMSKGLAAMNFKNYREAVTQFQAALTEMPTSVIAATQLKIAQNKK